MTNTTVHLLLAALEPTKASFAKETAWMPAATVDGVSLPRGKYARSYSGLGCWNSRSTGFMTAIRGMLGDPTAVAETPQMTLRRLQLYIGSKSSAAYWTEVAHALYKSSSCGNWGGLESLDYNADANAEALSLEKKSKPWVRAQLARLRTQARGDNDAAALLARILMDEAYQSTEQRDSWLDNLVKNRYVAKEQPEDAIVIWATVYPWVASAFYGPSTVVHDVDNRERSADIPYIAKLQDEHLLNQRGKLHFLGQLNGGGLMGLYEEDVVNSDLGQLVVPGYGDSISGFEMRDPFHRSDATGAGLGPARIELAFYKRSIARGSTVVMVDTRGMEHPPDCITDSSSGAHPYLYSCHHFNWRSPGIPEVVPDTSQPVPIAAVFFTVQVGASSTDQNAVCDEAKRVLTSFDEHVVNVGSIQWPRIKAVISATRILCSGHVLAATKAQSCSSLLHNWRSQVAHPDRAQLVDNRFGFHDHDWRGSIPQEWTRLGPARDCHEKVPMPFPSPPPLSVPSPPPLSPTPPPPLRFSPPPLAPLSPSQLVHPPMPSPRWPQPRKVTVGLTSDTIVALPFSPPPLAPLSPPQLVHPPMSSPRWPQPRKVTVGLTSDTIVALHEICVLLLVLLSLGGYITWYKLLFGVSDGNAYTQDTHLNED